MPCSPAFTPSSTKLAQRDGAAPRLSRALDTTQLARHHYQTQLEEDDTFADELDAIRRGKSSDSSPTDGFSVSAEKQRMQDEVNTTLGGLGLTL